MTERERVERRRHLLARMAGNIAAGIAPPYGDISDQVCDLVALGAVGIAEAILRDLEEQYPDPPPPGRPEPTSIPPSLLREGK